MESPKKWLRLNKTGSPVLDVGIYDDFEDAKKMTSTVCQQVSVQKYEEDISSETDRALGDLCMYLDKHPEAYARVLRKRKQDELEESSLVSMVKSKVMKLVHGEDYPENLVSTSECVQRTNSLKAGLCKTFQYSQETKGTPNSHSKRLAAKRNAISRQQKRKSKVDDLSSSRSSITTGSDSHKKTRQRKSPATVTTTDTDNGELRSNGSLISSSATVTASVNGEEEYGQNGTAPLDVKPDIGRDIVFHGEEMDQRVTEQSTSPEPTVGFGQDRPCTSPAPPPPHPPSSPVSSACQSGEPHEPLLPSPPQAPAGRETPTVVVTRRSLRVGRDGDHRENLLESSLEGYESASSTLGYSPLYQPNSQVMTPKVARKRSQKSSKGLNSPMEHTTARI